MNGMSLGSARSYPIEPERLAQWVTKVCQYWSRYTSAHADGYWVAIDCGAEAEAPPADIEIPVEIPERSGAQPGLLRFTGDSVWLVQDGYGVELWVPRPSRPPASPEMVTRFMSYFGIQPLDILPETGPAAACSTGDVLGPCALCGRGVLDYAAKWTGWDCDEHILLVHAECALAHHGTDSDDETPRETKMVRAFRRDLDKVRTPTLYSMIAAFNDATPEEQREHAWRADVVRDAFEARLDRKRHGGTPEIDADLAGAVAALDAQD